MKTDMRPFLIHFLILTFFTICGVALFTMEGLSPQTSGGLIKQFTFTKLYWLALVGYSLISTFIVLSVGIVYKIRKKSLTKKAVVFSHIIPIALVWIFFSLGLHDMIKDALKNRSEKLLNNHRQAEIEQTEKKKLPIPVTPLSKKLSYKTPYETVEPDMQKSK